MPAGAEPARKKGGGRKKRWRAAKPDAAQACGDLTAFLKRGGGPITEAMREAFGSIKGRHEQKCTYRPEVLGWAAVGQFLFRNGSVNAMDADRGLGSYAAWLREVSGLAPDPDAEAPCGELLRLWCGRADISKVNEILATAFETLALRDKRLEAGRIGGFQLMAVDGTGRENCREGTEENGKKRRVALVLSTLAAWGKVPVHFVEVDRRDWLRDKADCERRAFERLARWLKKRFPKLKICLVGDALYPSRSFFRTCELNGWHFIGTFKQGSWKGVYEEAERLLELTPENRGRYNPTGWRAHRRDAAGRRVPTDGEVRWVEGVDFGQRGRSKVDRYRMTVVECDEVSPMPYHGRFVTDLPCRDAATASLIATCGRKRWWIEAQNRTQKHLGYGLGHNFCNDSNASKVLFAFLLLAALLWEVFYKLGLRYWQPDTRKTSERKWAELIRGVLIHGTEEQWRTRAAGHNLKRA